MMIVIHDGIEWRNQRCSFTLLQMKIDHGCFQFGVSEQFFDGVDVNALVEQMGSEAVSQGVRGVPPVFVSGNFHALGYHVTDSAFVHGAVRDVSFEEIFFGSVLAIVCSQIFENESGQNGEPVFVSFSLHDFDLHGCAVDAGDFEHTQLIESESGPIEQTDHATVLDVFY